MGTKWTIQHKGVSADAIIAESKGKVVQDFCRQRGMKMSARFELNAYGEPTCRIMAEAWAHRMQFFKNICDEHGSDTHVVTPEELDQYLPPQSFLRLAGAASGPLAKRCAYISSLFA